MAVCNYFYLSQSAITPLRYRIVILHDAGVLTDAIFTDMIYWVDEISESLNYYSDTVKKGLGEL